MYADLMHMIAFRACTKKKRVLSRTSRLHVVALDRLDRDDTLRYEPWIRGREKVEYDGMSVVRE
jgi:hypothetical protein